MYQDAVVAWDVEQTWHISLAELLVVGILGKLGRLHVHREGVCAGGDGGHAVHLASLDFRKGHLLVESPVCVLYAVGNINTVDIDFSYAIVRTIIYSYMLNFHNRIVQVAYLNNIPFMTLPPFCKELRSVE